MSMQGRVCLVTGATSGIGRAAALALARRGATVVAVGRDRARGERVLEELRAAGGRDAALLLADLSSQAEVRRLAADFLARHERLDVLVNNAGGIFPQRRLSVDGVELTLAVDHLAPFLLTALLAERLARSAPARVVTVSSDAHRVGRIDLDDLQLERRWTPMRAYAQAKLANVLFTRALARRMAERDVTANALHPGVVATNFAGDATGIVRLVFRLARPFSLSPERGADTLVYLASSPEVTAVTGGYFEKRRQRRPSRAAEDEALAEALWERSARIVGLA